MDLILFLLFAFFIIILSIKLSYYADMLDKNNKLGPLIIGGMLLSCITSIPELIISLSHITYHNSHLILNSILNSNIYNILLIVIFDMIYIKKKFMNQISSKYLSIHLILIYMYMGIISYFEGNLIGAIYNIGLPTILIFLGFLAYTMVISNTNINEESYLYRLYDNKIKSKLIFIILAIIIASIGLSYFANNIYITYSSFWISLISIVTCLPELISTLYLIKKENYNLAYANVIGSIMINLIVLSIVDIFLSDKIIYDFFDNNIMVISNLGLWFIIILMYPVIRKKSWNNISYIIPSLMILIIYIYYIVIQFRF